MVTRAESILWAVLERCSRTPEGYPLKSTNGIAEGLAKCGLVVIRDGRVITTDKGKSVLRVLAFKIKEKRKQERKRESSSRRTLH